jgi:hypothetical protein
VGRDLLLVVDEPSPIREGESAQGRVGRARLVKYVRQALWWRGLSIVACWFVCLHFVTLFTFKNPTNRYIAIGVVLVVCAFVTASTIVEMLRLWRSPESRVRDGCCVHCGADRAGRDENARCKSCGNAPAVGRCAGCGYSREGIAKETACPECGYSQTRAG